MVITTYTMVCVYDSHNNFYIVYLNSEYNVSNPNWYRNVCKDKQNLAIPKLPFYQNVNQTGSFLLHSNEKMWVGQVL